MHNRHYSCSPSQSSKNHGRRFILFGIAVVIAMCLAGRSFWQAPHSAEAQSNAAAAVQTDAVIETLQQTIDGEAMQTKIEAIIGSYPHLDIAVSVVDLQDGTGYNYGLSNTAFIAASTTKVLTATFLLQQVEKGNASLSQPIGDSTASNLLRQMIVHSDNSAWYALNTFLGEKNLQTYAENLGMVQYDHTSNSLASADMALLLKKLYTGELLNAENTKLLLGYMRQADQTEYIVDAVGDAADVYHKAGYLEDRVLDVAIIDNGTHPYVLVIFSKATVTYDPAEEMQLFSDITAATLGIFN